MFGAKRATHHTTASDSNRVTTSQFFFGFVPPFRGSRFFLVCRTFAFKRIEDGYQSAVMDGRAGLYIPDSRITHQSAPAEQGAASRSLPHLNQQYPRLIHTQLVSRSQNRGRAGFVDDGRAFKPVPRGKR